MSSVDLETGHRRAHDLLDVLHVIDEVTHMDGVIPYSDAWRTAVQYGLEPRLRHESPIGRMLAPADAVSDTDASHVCDAIFILIMAHAHESVSAECRERLAVAVATYLTVSYIGAGKSASDWRERDIVVMLAEHSDVAVRRCRSDNDTTTRYYTVPWTLVLRLVASRRVTLCRGQALVTGCHLVSVCRDALVVYWRNVSDRCFAARHRLLAERNVQHMVAGLRYTPSSTTAAAHGSIGASAAACDDNSCSTEDIADRCPPCMAHVFRTLHTQRHLTCAHRFAAITYMKNAMGLSADTAKTHMRTAMSADALKRIQLDGIVDGIYKRDYSCQSCATRLTSGACPLATRDMAERVLPDAFMSNADVTDQSVRGWVPVDVCAQLCRSRGGVHRPRSSGLWYAAGM